MKWTKEEAIEKYRTIRKRHGDKAKSCQWMEDNDYGGLVSYVRRRLKTRWNEFKGLAGFDNDHLYISWNSDKQYICKSYEWMATHGHGSLLRYVCDHFDSWNEFKIKCGFNDGLLHESWNYDLVFQKYHEAVKKYGVKAKNSKFIYVRGYSGLVGYVNKKFGSWRKFLDFYNFSYKMSDKELRIEL